MYRCVFLIFTILSLNSYGFNYSQNEINQFNKNTQNKQLSKEFVLEFFTSNDPVQFIDDHIKESKNPLLLEYQLYQLLNEVSYQTKQDFLQKFVGQMKAYKTQAHKIHDEGRVPVPIFNIHAKAVGIENIWLASDAFVYYQRSFAQDSIAALLDLKDSLPSLRQPEWFGLKKSITTINPENQDLMTAYLLEDSKNLIGLDKFVAHYALFTANQELTELALQNLDKSNSEYLLRNLNKYFDKSFVMEQLIAAVEGDKNANFAISMMVAHIDEKQIEAKLFSLLVDEKHSKQAAMALAYLEKESSIMNMQTLFIQSDSEQVKKQITFALKMNHHPSAHVVLEQILKTHDNDLQTDKWLGSFNGEIQ